MFSQPGVFETNGRDRPEQVLINLYEHGIDACLSRDAVKATKVLDKLIDALNFEYTEMASSFYDLYQYAIGILAENRFDEVRAILVELRDTWKQVVPAMDGASQRLTL